MVEATHPIVNEWEQPGRRPVPSGRPSRRSAQRQIELRCEVHRLALQRSKLAFRPKGRGSYRRTAGQN